MITENLSTLKIHKLTQAQYDRELAAGNIDPNALYLTPDDGNSIANADFIPAPTTAEIGQTIVVKAVDENGKPTEWETADLPQGGGSSEWELVFDKTFTDADIGTVYWEVSPSSPAEEIVVIASNLLSTKDMGFSISVNDKPIVTNIPYLIEEGTSNKQVYCALKSDVWKVDVLEYGYDALAKGDKLMAHPNASNYTVVGKLPAVGKATKIKFGQSTAQDYQVRSGSVRIYAR